MSDITGVAQKLLVAEQLQTQEAMTRSTPALRQAIIDLLLSAKDDLEEMIEELIP